MPLRLQGPTGAALASSPALTSTFAPLAGGIQYISEVAIFGTSYVHGVKLAGGYTGHAALTAGSTAITSASFNDGSATVGMGISGPGIPDGATVTAVTSGNPTAMSLPASETRADCPVTAGVIRDSRWSGRVARALGAKPRSFARAASRAWLQGADQGGFASALTEVRSLRTTAPYQANYPLTCIMHGINDVGDYDNLPRFIHALRLMVSRSRAAGIFEETHSSVVLGGTWTAGGTTAFASGGTNKQTGLGVTTETVTVTMPADFPAGAVASFVFNLVGDDRAYRSDGVYRFRRGGVTLASMDTRNLMGATSNIMTACQRIAGLAAGDVVVIDFPTPPQQVFFDCWMIEAPTPPLVVLLKQPLLTSTGYAVYTGTTVTDARVNALNTAIDALAAEFTDGAVVTVDLSALNKQVSMFNSDGLHPNELGHAVIADAVLAKISQSQALLTRAAVTSAVPVRGY